MTRAEAFEVARTIAEQPLGNGSRLVHEMCKALSEDDKFLADTAARLDRLCESAEKGASWESAGHLRNRMIAALRGISGELLQASSKGKKAGR
jgi:hypothetical protein